MNFAFKDIFKKIFCPYNPKKEPIKFFFGNCLSGGAAGGVSSCLTYPLDFGRTRLAADVGSGKNREFKGLTDCLISIAKSDGMQGLYRGFGISIIGIVSYRATYFGCFDTGKVMLFPDMKHANPVVVFVFANVITIAAGLLAYPFDTVKRRMMMQSGRKSGEILYSSSMDCIRKMIVQEGYRSFFKGALSNVIRGSGGALVLVLDAKAKAYLFETEVVLKAGSGG